MIISNLERILELCGIEYINADYNDNLACACPYQHLHSKGTDRRPSFSVLKKFPYYYNCFSCGKTGEIMSLVLDIFTGAIAPKFNKKLIYHKKEIANLIEKIEEGYKDEDIGNSSYENVENNVTIEHMYDIYSPCPFEDEAIFSDPKISDVEKINSKAPKQVIEELVKRKLMCFKDNFYIDRKRERLLLPINWSDGTLVGYTGRKIGKLSHYENKYLFYGAKRFRRVVLYNEKSLRDSLASTKPTVIVLVEGPFKALHLLSSVVSHFISSHGINIIPVATFGTTVTKQQIFKLNQIDVPKLIFFDRDEAGRLAATKLGQTLSNSEIMDLVILYGHTHKTDPDDFSSKELVDIFVSTNTMAELS